MRECHRSSMLRHVLCVLAGLMGAWVVPGPAPALAGTRLKVTVYQGTLGGSRVGGATVCLGTVGRTTSSTGEAVFETVADGTHTLSAWKSGFSRATASLLVNEYTVAETTRVLLLQAGTGTAPCQVSSSSSSSPVSYSGTAIVPISPGAPSRLNPTGRATATQIYEIRADLAAREAGAKGYTFSVNGVSQGEPGARIGIAHSDIYLDPAAGGLFGSKGLFGSPASFNLFVGRTLKPGWQYYNVSVDASKCPRSTVQWITSPSGNSLAMTIRITFDALDGGYSIKTIRLKGPAGRDWKEAFAQ
jgi:hypothetical protein